MGIVGVDALFSTIKLPEMSEDQFLEEMIIDVFIPLKFIRVDKIISTVFECAIHQEEEAYKMAGKLESEYFSDSHREDTKQSSNNLEVIKNFKVLLARKMASKKFGKSFHRVRSLFDSAGVRISVAVSKCYDRLDKYGYVYHPRHIDFLNNTG